VTTSYAVAQATWGDSLEYVHTLTIIPNMVFLFLFLFYFSPLKSSTESPLETVS
jgi:hypothetical protein